MQKTYNQIICFLLALVVCITTLPLGVSAAGLSEVEPTVDGTAYIVEGNAVISQLVSKINDYANRQILTYSSGSGVVTFHSKEYAELNASDKQALMVYALDSIEAANLGYRIKMKFYNFVADRDTPTTAVIRKFSTDTSADISAASSWIFPFSGAVGTVLGVICIFIFMFLGLGTALDIAWMVIPAFRALVEHTWNSKPWFISSEAFESVMMSERGGPHGPGSGGGSNYLSNYLRKRAWTMIILCLAILYLVSGEIYDVVVFFMNAFSGVNIISV